MKLKLKLNTKDQLESLRDQEEQLKNVSNNRDHKIRFSAIYKAHNKSSNDAKSFLIMFETKIVYFNHPKNTFTFLTYRSEELTISNEKKNCFILTFSFSFAFLPLVAGLLVFFLPFIDRAKVVCYFAETQNYPHFSLLFLRIMKIFELLLRKQQKKVMKQ